MQFSQYDVVKKDRRLCIVQSCCLGRYSNRLSLFMMSSRWILQYDVLKSDKRSWVRPSPVFGKELQRPVAMYEEEVWRCMVMRNDCIWRRGMKMLCVKRGMKMLCVKKMYDCVRRRGMKMQCMNQRHEDASYEQEAWLCIQKRCEDVTKFSGNIFGCSLDCGSWDFELFVMEGSRDWV